MPDAIEPTWTMQLKDRNTSFSVNGDCMLPRISISSGQGFCCRQISEALTGQALEFVSWGQGVSRPLPIATVDQSANGPVMVAQLLVEELQLWPDSLIS